jgi:hypothetical protein
MVRFHPRRNYDYATSNPEVCALYPRTYAGPHLTFAQFADGEPASALRTRFLISGDAYE